MSDCLEIQGQWCPKNFTSYHAYHKRLKRLGDFIYGVQWQNSDTEELIWLPRQDQIQEMFVEQFEKIFRTYYSIYCLFQFFSIFYDGPDTLNKFDSAEQLWQAFYMKEMHNKIWDKDKWIKR